MPSYRWWLQWGPDVEKQLSSLSKSERAGFFNKMALLASAENPYSVQGVEKLIEKRFQGQRRIRQGNYRMRFMIHPGEITHNKAVYLGILEILAILDRKDAYK